MKIYLLSKDYCQRKIFVLFDFLSSCEKTIQIRDEQTFRKDYQEMKSKNIQSLRIKR